MVKIPYGRQTITKEDINAVATVLQSDYLTQGPEIQSFEKTVAKYHRAKYAVAFSSGTAALHAAYSVLGVEEGDDIITSPITFAATANAAVYCGARPIFADIDDETNCIDPGEIEKVMTSTTKVVSPVAYAGYPVDLQSVSNVARGNGCKVLYDAAHAIGSLRNGSFGMVYVDAAILSFHPVKHIAAGEGGMVLTNDESVFRKLLLFRSHGITKDPEELETNDGPWYYEMQSLGYNYRITDIQCALANSQFHRIKDNLKKRNSVAQRYNYELNNLDYLQLPPDVGFCILEEDDFEKVQDIHSYHLYTLHLTDKMARRQFYDYLHDKGILAQIHYVPVHLHPYYRKRYGYKPGDYPKAEAFYNGEVSIPMYHGLKDEDIEYTINTIKSFLK